MLERVTKVFCGSDQNSDFSFDQALGQGDFGALHTNAKNRVWFTKTCHPTESKTQGFNGQKMIVVARNPYDIIKESADHKNLFGCSDRLQIDERYPDNHFEWWDKWVNIQTENIGVCHEFLITNMAQKLPTLFVRYEDLVSEPAHVMTNVFKFVLGVSSISGTFLERRINELAADMVDPDAANTSSISLFLTQQRQHIGTSLQQYNEFFGYTQQPGGHFTTRPSSQANLDKEQTDVAQFAFKDGPQDLEL